MKEQYIKIILLVLVAVVAIQGYYLYDMRRTGITSQEEPEPFTVMPSKSSDIRALDKLFKDRSDPFKEMERLQREMESNFRDFDDFFQNDPTFKRSFSLQDRTPRFDMKEHKGRYIITVEIPGSDKQSIDVQAKDGRLSISSKVTQETEDNTTNYFRHERRASSFRREVSLPDDADEGSLKTEYKDGVLTITLEKKKL